MADYIKREDALRFALFCVRNILDSNISLQDKFDEIPSADVVEVKTAHWVRMSEKEVFGEINMQCSECAFDDWRTPTYWKTWGNFCPNCGADMRGE